MVTKYILCVLNASIVHSLFKEELTTAMEVNISSTEEEISPKSAIMGSEKLEFTDYYEGEFGKVNITCRCDVPGTNDWLV